MIMIDTRSLPLLCLVFASCAARPAGYDDRLSAWQRRLDAGALERGAAPSGSSDGDSGEDSDGRDGIDESTELGALLRHARANNPGLLGAFQRWKEALERVPQVTALPKPRFSFTSYLREVETRVGPMESRFALTQMFPWFGKLDLAGESAFEASEAARELLEATRLELDQRIRDAWYELAWLEQAIIVTDGNRELLTHWESVARARLETGLGRHSDVIRAQVELGKLEDRAATLLDMRRPLEARLNAALGRPPDAPLPRPSLPLPAPPRIDDAALASTLLTTSPALRAMEYRVRAAQHGIDLADKAFYPDFFIGADYTVIGTALNPATPGSGDDAVAVTLGLDLPVWRSSNRAGQREAEAQVKRARLEQDEMRNRLSAELEMALYRFRDADRRVGLYQGSLIPKGEESIRSVDTAYQAGDGGFLDLIDAERVLLEFQLQGARAEADRAKAAADIERITGIDLHPEPRS